jgi:hypothetical protein
MCSTVEWSLSGVLGTLKVCSCSVADTSGEVCGVKGCIEKHAYGCVALQCTAAGVSQHIS